MVRCGKREVEYEDDYEYEGNRPESDTFIGSHVQEKSCPMGLAGTAHVHPFSLLNEHPYAGIHGRGGFDTPALIHVYS